ncbi:MAG: DUF4388 domain-containing protein [Chitinispirillales bacterium]|jgi:hypothetical protein|nr:DUF4388 domain-containing protein [Chitinispirillales bacterium]
MVLNGTLKEFILADVFNLLTQQRITGRLDLASGKREAMIVFKEGFIVGGADGEESLANKLFNYLIDIKRKTSEQLSPIFSANTDDLSALSSALLERNLLTAAELKGFAGSCIEDICCSLLTWNEGTYRFNSVGSVSTIACGVVTISAENIIMEGMRRVDEWARMRDYITEDMVFAPAPNSVGSDIPPGEIDIAAAPEEYVFGLLDGNNTVKSIKKSCCLCEYKVYESLNFLLQAQRITAVQQHYSESIRAALARKEAEVASVLRTTHIGSLVAAGVAAAFVIFFVFCRLVLLPKLDPGTYDRAVVEQRLRSEASQSDAVHGASLLYRTVNGGDGKDEEALKRAGLLTDRDLLGKADIYGRIF